MGWFSQSVESPSADLNGRHQHGHGQRGGSNSQLNAGCLRVDTSVLVWAQNSICVCLQLNFNLLACVGGQYAHDKRAVEENWNLASALSMLNFHTPLWSQQEYFLKLCGFCHKKPALWSMWAANTNAYSAGIVAPIEIGSIHQKSLLALLLLFYC